MLNTILHKKLTFYIFIILYIYYLWNFDAKFGFSPTDEARILGYIERISNGDLPHLDFIFPHLAGTAYLYYFFNFLDSDVIFLQRFIGVLNLVLYSYILLKILGKEFTKQNAIIKFLLLVLSLNINMHTFSLYIWSTTDAILISILASYFIHKSDKFKLLGYFLLGSVPILKSGFIFSTLILFIYFILNEELSIKRLIRPSISFSIIPFSYLGLLFFNGGIDEMFYELFVLPKFWNRWFQNLGLFDFKLITTTFITCLPFFFIHKRIKNFDIAIPILFSIIFIVFSEDFSLISHKPRFFLYSLFVFIAIYIQKKNTPDLLDFELPFLLCVVLGFCSTLSDGWAVSLWVNGSILALSIMLIFKVSILLNSYLDKNEVKTFLKLLIIVLIFYIPFTENTEARNNYTYRDLSDNSKLTYNLKNLNKYYGNIYTSENVYEYLSSIQECISKIDSKNISVYPDNPIIYSMYNLKNPLIIDRYEGYFVSTDYDDIKLFKNIENLNADPDAEFAILLQTYPANRLVEIDRGIINKISDRNDNGFWDEVLNSINYIENNLDGDISSCNSFVMIQRNIGK
jgi:hypothetical protein